MASEEERANIIAEYMQAADRDVEDEEEFQGEDDDEDDGDDGHDSFDEDSDSDNDGETAPKKDDNYAVLKGILHMNDEGRLVYSGTWCMKKDLAKQAQSSDKGKKKTKFKLKSKQALGTTKGKFDLLNPLLAEKKPRTILFDGFFTTDDTDTVQPHRKIKERDIELIFSQGVPMKKSEGAAEAKAKEGCFVVKGKGANDFGAFGIEGIYCPSSSAEEKDGHPLTCSKRYGGFESTVGSKRSRDYDSEDDYEISGDEAADMDELIGLHEEADMSVEELRKKYYGGDDEDEDEDGELPAKRSKVVEEDDDDGCGF